MKTKFIYSYRLRNKTVRNIYTWPDSTKSKEDIDRVIAELENRRNEPNFQIELMLWGG